MKEKSRGLFRILVMLCLLLLVWGGAGYYIKQEHSEFNATTWYEVEATCSSSTSYEETRKTIEKVRGQRKTIYKTETRYKVKYTYVAKDGNEYTYIRDSEKDVAEGTKIVILVDEANPAHSTSEYGQEMQKNGILIVSGTISFLIVLLFRITSASGSKSKSHIQI